MDSTSEINVTLYHLPTSKTDAISISKFITVEELAELAVALLDLANDDAAGNNNVMADGGDADGGGVKVVLARSMEGTTANTAGAASAATSLTVLYHPQLQQQQGMAKTKNSTLESCNITDGSLILVYRVQEYEMLNRRSATSSASSTAPAAGGRNAVGSGGGGAALGGGSLDFSALLGGNSGRAAASNNNNNAGGRGGGGGSLDFSSLIASAASSGVRNNGMPSTVSNNRSTATNNATSPIEWDGMSLDAAIQHNPNPYHLMSILTNTSRHPNLFKELNYHQPALCKQLQSANGNLTEMAQIWRVNFMKSTTSRYLKHHTEKNKEESMKQRLLINPTDAIANEYFGNKIRLSNVQAQYEQMMEDYPESMGRVLMLYINCTANGHPLQVFVDSGAQNTIMSGRCAERLNLSHLIDTRFEGVAVGVGTGKIAGRIHVVILNIGGYDFPCSITVMDDGDSNGRSTGLGNKNMDCLFGLDMLKRHRCNIDLEKNVLRFAIGHRGAGNVEYMEAPFLHEKDLPTSKGGTMDFNAEEENALVEARMERMETDEEDEDVEEVDGAGKKMDGESK
ncbi:hypothetical protein ACHAWU_001362 [Discostella pseudostelligera]|uniref:Aspartic peptidase DDI1-type domain-containing protein n=1 Tax=Discostella pseudostelligera TaxID=259834 RepID=A0ABD3M474_9STRA